jgi:hypothetical protein
MTQFVLWATFIGPWFLLIPLDVKRVKQFLSVAFFTLVLTSIYWQTGEVYNWWTIKNNIFFLSSISAFNYGFLPVVTIYIFYFTYSKPLLFFMVNIILDAIQAFVISPFIFEKLQFYKMDTMNNLGLFIIILSLLPIIYFYQRWYDKS